MEKIIQSLKRKGIKSEIIYEKSIKTTVKFKTDFPYSISVKEEEGYGIRVISNGKLGFSSTNSEKRLKETADNAVHLSKYGEPAFFDFPSLSSYSSLKVTNKKIENLSSSKLLEIGREIVDTIKTIDEEMKVDITLVNTKWERNLKNSSGLSLLFKKSAFYLFVSFLRVTDEGLVSSTEFFNLSDGKEFPIDEVRAWIKKEKEFIEKKVKFKEGIYDVIFYPDALSSIIFPALAQGINGVNFIKRVSPLVESEDKKICDERISIYDDPLLDYKVYSAPWDGEGVPHQRNSIIDKGIFKGFLFDLQTAAKAKRKTTGNSIRSYANSSNPGTTNIVIERQDKDFEGMLQEIKKGVIVKEVLGGGMANTMAGAFSVTVSHGYMVEHGEITGRVKDLAIAGNIYSLLNQVKEIGNKTKELPGFISPAILFEKVRIASKK